MTTTKTRVVAYNQQVVRLDCEDRSPLPARLEDELLQEAEARMSEVDACILSDYGKGVVSARVSRHFIRLARQASKPVVVDPKGADYSKYRGATVVKPNLHEAEAAAKQPITSEADLEEVGSRLVDFLENSALLVTRGADGMSLFRANAPSVHIPTLARRVFDVTGAGDTVASVLALGLAADGDLEDAVHVANRAASVVVGKVGAATLSPEELLSELRPALLR
jgi:D-beta-D-heptose 7-phosphate kinase/D-beta-D-heptose 1-phosphate adenosyltransferase